MITRAPTRETPDEVPYDPSPVGYPEEAPRIGILEARGDNGVPTPAVLPRLPLEAGITRGYGAPVFRALAPRANTR